MIVIYGCHTGTHAAVVAAALHLGWLNPGRLPTWEEVKQLPYFDAGTVTGLLFIGQDQAGRRVYVAAIGKEGSLVSRAIPSFLKILGRRPSEAAFIDLASGAPRGLRWGGFLRRYPWGQGIGSWLIRRGLQAYYPRMASSLQT